MRSLFILCLANACCFSPAGGVYDDADADPLAPDAARADAAPGAVDGAPADAGPPPDWVGVYRIDHVYMGTCAGGDANLSFDRLEFDENGIVTTWKEGQPIVPVRTTIGYVTAPNTLHVNELVMADYGNGQTDRLETFDATGDGQIWSATMVDLIWSSTHNPGCTEVWDLTGTRL